MSEAAPRFSAWHATEHTALVSAPTEAGVIQVKSLGSLHVYPHGKSAMVWYGSADNCRTALEVVLPALQAAWPHRTLRWRFRTTNQAAAEHQRLLERFIRRFGTPPVGQTSFE